MAYDGKTCCPRCGTEQAVAKSVAWDAAAEIPPKVAMELDRLHQVEIAANALISASPHSGNETTVVVTGSIEMLNRLAKASSREMSN